MIRKVPLQVTGQVALILIGGVASPSTAATEDRYRFGVDTSARGLDERPARSWGSSWTDYDRDGDPDLFVGRHGRPPRLYLNAEGTFSPVQGVSFSPSKTDRHGRSSTSVLHAIGSTRRSTNHVHVTDGVASRASPTPVCCTSGSARQRRPRSESPGREAVRTASPQVLAQQLLSERDQHHAHE